VVLAGGKATRMRPYTEDRPKAMVEVAGSPIVEHQIRWLKANGVEEIVVSCGYRAEMLQEHLADGSSLGVQIIYAVEAEPLGRGGGLKFAARRRPHPDERTFALNGDVISRFALSELLEHHTRVGATATVALAAYKTTWGIADLDGGLIRGFRQSPTLPYWINGGIYVLEPECVDLLPDRGDHEDSTFPELAQAGKLGGYRIEGYWRGIDTVKDVLEATRDLEEIG
ncbi:MAG TPA: nucleotidyltransferase family protein, partial [Actinomycetota bacterium]|nr:nucleotidyltransferase family protein [Actinomycetota bacterium]